MTAPIMRPARRPRGRSVAARLETARVIVKTSRAMSLEISVRRPDRVAALLSTRTTRPPMATLATPIRDESIYRDPACVKVVRSARGRRLYSSRTPDPPSSRRTGFEPHQASSAAPDRLSASGSLRLSPRLPAGPRQVLASFEGSRPLKSFRSSFSCSTPSYPDAVGVVEEPSIGIDTPEDYRRFVARRWKAGAARRRAKKVPGILLNPHRKVQPEPESSSDGKRMRVLRGRSRGVARRRRLNPYDCHITCIP